MKKIVSDKSAAIERGNLANVALQKELEASSNKVDALGKKITKMETELTEAAARLKEMDNKRSELKKMNSKLQEAVNKKEQVGKNFALIQSFRYGKALRFTNVKTINAAE